VSGCIKANHPALRPYCGFDPMCNPDVTKGYWDLLQALANHDRFDSSTWPNSPSKSDHSVGWTGPQPWSTLYLICYRPSCYERWKILYEQSEAGHAKWRKLEFLSRIYFRDTEAINTTKLQLGLKQQAYVMWRFWNVMTPNQQCHSTEGQWSVNQANG